MSEETPPRRLPTWRKLVGLAVLVAGAALIATTVGSGQKEPVELHVSLPKGIKQLRLDVHREQKLVDHLEWTYLAQKPLSQDAHLELPPGEYVVTVHAQGAGLDPAPQELHVVKGEVTRLDTEVR